MLLKAVGQSLGTAKRYNKDAGKFRWAIGKLLAILKEFREATGKCPNTCCQPIGEEVELPSSYYQNCGKFPSLFS
jgi:hypothetical protein